MVQILSDTNTGIDITATTSTGTNFIDNTALKNKTKFIIIIIVVVVNGASVTLNSTVFHDLS